MRIVISYLNKIKNNKRKFLIIQKLDGPPIEMSNSKPQQHHHHLERLSNLSDDEPLYDAVASDDDYAALTPINQNATSILGQQQVTSTQKKPLKINSIG